MKLERIYLSGYSDKKAPKCPDCGAPIAYIGIAPDLIEGAIINHKLYRCSNCLGIYKATDDNQ